MTKKWICMLTLLVLLLCGSLGVRAEEIIGQWELTGAEYQGMFVDRQTLGDVEMILQLREDGSARSETRTDEGEDVGEGVWSISGTTLTLADHEQSLDFTVEDGRLTFQQGELLMIFEKSEEVNTASAAPAASAGEREFSVNPTVQFDSGLTTVSWVDTAENGPYQVAYMYYDGSDVVQSGIWAGGDMEGSTTSQKSFQTRYLAPGNQYVITVFDKDNMIAEGIITMPEKEEFVDGKFKASSVRVSTEYRYIRAEGEKPRAIERLTASDMMAHMADQQFGLYYRIDLPELAYARDYLVQLVLYAPNGYTYTENCTQHVFSQGTGFYYSQNFIGNTFFARMYEKNGVIPAGTYTAELYFNGMLANTKTFKVY